MDLAKICRESKNGSILALITAIGEKCMRIDRATFLTALLCVEVVFACAQGQRSQRTYQAPKLPDHRVVIKALPPPPPGAHGHLPDNRSGKLPCGNARLATFSDCTGSNSTKQPSDGQYSNGNQSNSDYPSRGGGGGKPRTPYPYPRPVVLPPFDYGWGIFENEPILTMPQERAQKAVEQLSQNGPQFSAAISMSNFRVTGLERGGWPVVVDYEAEPGAYVQMTIVTQGAPPAQATLAVLPQTSRRLQLLRLPDVFGASLKPATFSIDAMTSATDPTPRYLRIYGFGCGRRAVGSVAIDNLRFGPQAVTVSDPETHFGFHTHAMFDKMKSRVHASCLRRQHDARANVRQQEDQPAGGGRRKHQRRVEREESECWSDPVSCPWLDDGPRRLGRRLGLGVLTRSRTQAVGRRRAQAGHVLHNNPPLVFPAAARHCAHDRVLRAACNVANGYAERCKAARVAGRVWIRVAAGTAA